MASTQEGPEPPLTPSEKQFLRDNFGGEFLFMRSHGLDIFKEQDRDEGRAILRAFQQWDFLPVGDHDSSPANEAAPEPLHGNHFRAGDRAEETQLQHKISNGSSPVDGANLDEFGHNDEQHATCYEGYHSGNHGGCSDWNVEAYSFGQDDGRNGPHDAGYDYGRDGDYDGGYEYDYEGGHDDDYDDVCDYVCGYGYEDDD
ncbi:unnamed protein product [Clonostachys rosea]|uniref:Non-haem dioxygenase N-terminal domain-containing protein n=1 Tax=Bionectria ochroleuca TaxID=29856 RepID=A0ABY6U6X7_BIOOC|nr:unnamed protein product [Clonostachys rosea]